MVTLSYENVLHWWYNFLLDYLGVVDENSCFGFETEQNRILKALVVNGH